MFFEFLSFFRVPSNIMVSLGPAGIALLAIGYARAGRLAHRQYRARPASALDNGSGITLPLEKRFPRWDATRGPPAGVVVLGGGVIKSQFSADSRPGCRWRYSGSVIAAVELARRYPNARVVFVGRSEADFVTAHFHDRCSDQ